jgi:hypothetical protein
MKGGERERKEGRREGGREGERGEREEKDRVGVFLSANAFAHFKNSHGSRGANLTLEREGESTMSD